MGLLIYMMDGCQIIVVEDARMASMLMLIVQQLETQPRLKLFDSHDLHVLDFRIDHADYLGCCNLSSHADFETDFDSGSVPAAVSKAASPISSPRWLIIHVLRDIRRALLL